MIALHVRTGHRLKVSLGGAPVFREVVDTYLLNLKRKGSVVLVIDCPEAPEGSLRVTLPPGAEVEVEREQTVQHGNLREYLAARGMR